MPTKTRNPKRSRLRLALPATSANLGPAFDAAALAMDFYIKLEARAAKEFSIIANGRDHEICGKLEDHLILDTYREVLQAAGREVNALSLRIDNDIPIGKGCGSSAAARLAGIALAVCFGRLRWTDAQIVGEASRREHHPDNASACWMGGLTIARMSGSTGEALDDAGAAQVACVRPKGKWPLLLAVPDESLSTKEARLVLPTQYSRADAVINVQNSMLLLAAFTQGRPDLLASALEDRIHQPYRAALCPLLPCLQELKGKPGILGAALSGAGPSVLMFLDPRNLDPLNDARQRDPRAALQKTRRLVADHLAQNHLRAELIPTSITLRGARSSFKRS
ncbi:MAG: homoserine kinase [Candidatus Sulfotelmatobacter sp.]